MGLAVTVSAAVDVRRRVSRPQTVFLTPTLGPPLTLYHTIEVYVWLTFMTVKQKHPVASTHTTTCERLLDAVARHTTTTATHHRVLFVTVETLIY